MNHLWNKIYTIIGVGILIIGSVAVLELLVTGQETLNVNVPVHVVGTPIPTPITTPSQQTTPIAIIPIDTSPTAMPADPRIAEFKNLYGIELDDEACAAPCINGVRHSLTLGEFITKVGPPEKVSALFLRYDFSAELFYINRGFAIHARRPYRDNYTDVTPDMIIVRIDLWQARTFDDMVREMTKETMTGETLTRAQDWVGFGSVKVLNR